MSDRDEYLRIPGRAQYVRPHAVLFGVGDGVPRSAWIPRSVIHGADDIKLRDETDRINAMRGQGGIAMTLRIRRWKAEEVGFDGEQDDRTSDLFSQDGEIDF